MPTRDIYLKIEEIPAYTPVEPDPHAGLPIRYRRDCMRNPGHEDTSIPPDEVEARRLSVVIYREYLDPNYFVPKPDKIIAADINEPSYLHRVPGTVIYGRPGERLRIHVKNAAREPHSFHVHGLRYGIDSDGSWPFGTQSSDGRRSDEICPGQSWTYTYDVTADSVGAWPFHDHCRDVGPQVNRGLFGGIIVLPQEGIEPPDPFPLPRRLHELLEHVRDHHGPGHHHPGGHGHGGHGHGGHGHGGHGHGGGHAAAHCAICGMHGHVGRIAHCPVCAAQGHGHHDPVPPAFEPALAALEEMMHAPRFHPLPKPSAVLHVPLFFHIMSGTRGTPVFRSPRLSPGQSFSFRFTQEGVYAYFCELHGAGMAGTIRVVAGAQASANVTIVDNQFMPNDVTVGTVGPGGVGGAIVTWTNNGPSQHTATEAGGANLPSWCFNGRAFVGNTPTIVATAGQKIRFYLFNLDLSMMGWHNFHPHALRWRFDHQNIDIRSIGPAESFIVEAEAPPVLLLPLEIAAKQNPAHRPHDAREYRLRGDFLFHCHVEMHMMQGLAGLIRSHQSVWLTPAQADELAATVGLPLDPGPLDNSCPAVDLDRCIKAEQGEWQTGPAQQRTMMHAVLLPDRDEVLYWGHGPYADQSRLWELSSNGVSSPANHPSDIHPTQNIWSGSQAYIDDANGTILVHAGVSFSNVVPPPDQDPERIAFLFDPPSLTWSKAKRTAERRFYPTTVTLEDGRRHLALFGEDFPNGNATLSYEAYNPGPGGGSWEAVRGAPFNYFYYPWAFILPDGDLFISGPQKPARRFDRAANSNWTADPMVASASYDQVYAQRGSNMDGTALLLPLRPPTYATRIMLLGGSSFGEERSAEWIDLSEPNPAWTSLPDMNERHTKVSAVLLPDGRVWVAGGASDSGFMGPVEIFDPEDPSLGWVLGPSMTQRREYHSAAILLPDGSVLMGGGEPEDPNRPLERYFPSYFFKPRPTILAAPTQVAHAAAFTVQTPQAPAVGEVVLMRPGAVTHGFNQSQRHIGCVITAVAGNALTVTAPADGHIAPPGWYLLFLVDNDRVPSLGRWIRLSP